jgi:hypothetical protein
MFSDYVSFLVYFNLFEIKNFVVVVKKKGVILGS